MIYQQNMPDCVIPAAKLAISSPALKATVSPDNCDSAMDKLLQSSRSNSYCWYPLAEPAAAAASVSPGSTGLSLLLLDPRMYLAGRSASKEHVLVNVFILCAQ